MPLGSDEDQRVEAARVESVRVDAATFKEQIRTLFATVDRLEKALAKFGDTLSAILAGRPSWSVAIIIALLSSACVGEGVALLTLTHP